MPRSDVDPAVGASRKKRLINASRCRGGHSQTAAGIARGPL